MCCGPSSPPFPPAGFQHRPEDPQFGVIALCPNCRTVGGAGHGAAISCIESKGSFKSQFTCSSCGGGGGKVNIDTNSAAGSLAKALFCELRVTELRALASRDATQKAELLLRQKQAAAFRAKLPEEHRVPAPRDGLLSLDLGETGERLKKRVEAAAAKQAGEGGEEEEG